MPLLSLFFTEIQTFNVAPPSHFCSPQSVALGQVDGTRGGASKGPLEDVGEMCKCYNASLPHSSSSPAPSRPALETPKAPSSNQCHQYKPVARPAWSWGDWGCCSRFLPCLNPTLNFQPLPTLELPNTNIFPIQWVSGSCKCHVGTQGFGHQTRGQNKEFCLSWEPPRVGIDAQQPPPRDRLRSHCRV